MVKFADSLISMSSIRLFGCFLNNPYYSCQQMRGAYEMCKVIKDIMQSVLHM